jgi:hypothetical protein
VPVTDELVAIAADLADNEGLRGYDAVHLAAALTVDATVLSSADSALCAAAARRGLHIPTRLEAETVALNFDIAASEVSAPGLGTKGSALGLLVRVRRLSEFYGIVIYMYFADYNPPRSTHWPPTSPIGSNMEREPHLVDLVSHKTADEILGRLGRYCGRRPRNRITHGSSQAQLLRPGIRAQVPVRWRVRR